MIVEVLYFAEIKNITGKEQEKIELDKGHLGDLYNILIKKYGKKIKSIIWDEKKQEIHNLISILINNKAVQEKNPILVNLENGDIVVFLMPVSGG